MQKEKILYNFLDGDEGQSWAIIKNTKMNKNPVFTRIFVSTRFSTSIETGSNLDEGLTSDSKDDNDTKKSIWFHRLLRNLRDNRQTVTSAKRTHNRSKFICIDEIRSETSVNRVSSLAQLVSPVEHVSHRLSNRRNQRFYCVPTSAAASSQMTVLNVQNC